MTVALPATAANPERTAQISVSAVDVTTHLAVWSVLLWWALPLTRGTGGREPHLVSFGLVLVIAALGATSPWRRLRPRELAAAVSLPLAALVVSATAPTGWRGANDIGTWAIASGTYVVVRAYSLTEARRHALLAGMALVGLAEFSASWLAWWGGQNPAKPMIGTFYWHNQFGAFLLIPALVGAALAVWPHRATRAVGWVVAPICSAGILFSTSRATLGLLLVGWAFVGLVAMTSQHPLRSSVKLLILGIITVLTTFALTGPPFFPHRAAPSSAVQARSAQDSAQGDAQYRTKTWGQAVRVFEEHPVVGTGFHGFLSAATAAAPTEPHSAFAHDAWLQAFSDGGVLLGVPFVAVTLAVAGALARRCWRGIRCRADRVGVVTAAATLLLAAHSLIDFDLSYPSLFVFLAAAAAATLEPPQASGIDRRGRLYGAGAVAALAAVAVIGAVAAWHGSLNLNLNVPGAALVPGGAG